MANSAVEAKKICSKNSIILNNYKPENVLLDATPSFRHMLESKDVSGQQVPTTSHKGNPEVLSLAHPKIYLSPRPLAELDAAAVNVQKVYKSYRTRRNLADCAVVVEELWWKAIDSAALNHSSVSFYNNNEPETVISRWARQKMRVAMLGKGLTRDEKAQKLALQHWLEGIDARHRYGHNLHIYYDVWFESKSTEPFFYWLDIGQGKEVNLEKCPRSDLQRQCIKYLGPKEREAYEVVVIDGKLVHKQRQELVNTTGGSKWIFVLSPSRSLYVGQKKKGVFQHSSFLAGAATTAAGRLVAKNGILEAVWPYSGHYQPKEEHFREFMIFLEEHHVDLSNVKRYSIEDDEPSYVDPRHVGKTDSDRLDRENKAASDVNAPVMVVRQEDNTSSISSYGVEKPAFNLAKRLSCKWNSGVGPRIGCVRDYPAELQSQALEQVKLSPRVGPGPFLDYGPIPSPRPSPKIRVSPRLAYMGIPSPRPLIGSVN